MLCLPLEIQLHIIDLYLSHAYSDMLNRRRTHAHKPRSCYVSSVTSMALTSRLYWSYLSQHPDYARLRLFHFLDHLTRTVGECSLSIMHEAKVITMKAWSSSVFDGIAHGDLFFVENAVTSGKECHLVTKMIFLECVDTWARMNSYRVGVYPPENLKHSEIVDSNSVLRYGPQQRITRIRV